ncbi:MAG: adenylate/guanylate cyclase domain-containing protein, partial [Rhodospirillales bacterium]|nr:adenylate/guanylate cyclase domain-containing protein [Rhodospirillales bacterium]
MAGTNDVSFEVHVQKNGRWEIHAQYPSNKQTAAVTDAKALDRLSTVQAVKVIKDAFDRQAGASKETIVFASESLGITIQKDPPKKAAPKASEPQKKASSAPNIKISKQSKGSRRRSIEYDDAPAQGTSAIGLVIKLLWVLLFSTIIALALASLSGVWLKDSGFSNASQSNIWFAIFIITFLVSASYMAMRFIPKSAFASSPVQGSRNSKQSSSGKRTNTDVDDFDDEGPGMDADPIAEQEAVEDGLNLQDALSISLEDHRDYLMEFLDKSLVKRKRKLKKMDNFNRFGVNLYLAGASEAMGQLRQLGPDAVIAILAESAQAIGFVKADADSFAQRFNEYLMADSRYMQMFQAGRNAMNTYYSDQSVAPRFLTLAFEEWNKPKQKDERQGTVSVLFTDIAGSTAMTQDLGDAGAQEVVRAHNRIVREALSKFEGNEIKHTGDGIMASFNNASQSVEAASQMQVDTIAYTEANPELPLHLKIGINAGEPIAEDNDLFGTTVQLSARITDKAQGDQIFVSDTVYGICQGKGMQFVQTKKFDMKGFDGGLSLWEVVWREEVLERALEDATED